MEEMLEERAKTKWCPFARVRFIEPGPYVNTLRAEGENRKGPDGIPVLGSHCIASDCACWDSSEGSRYGHCGLTGGSR